MGKVTYSSIVLDAVKFNVHFVYSIKFNFLMRNYKRLSTVAIKIYKLTLFENIRVTKHHKLLKKTL